MRLGDFPDSERASGQGNKAGETHSGWRPSASYRAALTRRRQKQRVGGIAFHKITFTSGEDFYLWINLFIFEQEHSFVYTEWCGWPHLFQLL